MKNVQLGHKVRTSLSCFCCFFSPKIMWLLIFKGFVTMTLESPEEIQDVNCAWKELNRKLSSNAVSQITRMCLLKGNMVGFSRQIKSFLINYSKCFWRPGDFVSFFFFNSYRVHNTVFSVWWITSSCKFGELYK